MPPTSTSPAPGLRGADVRKGAFLALVAASILLTAGSGSAYADWSRRLAAATPDTLYTEIETCGREGSLSAGQALLATALRSNHPHVATACGDALANMARRGLGTAELVGAAIEKLGLRIGGKKHVREQANLARVLAAFGEGPVDEVLAAMASKRSPAELRIEAVLLAGEMSSPWEALPESRERVQAALADRNEDLQCAACAALARKWIPQAESTLVKLVNSSKRTRAGMYAVHALERGGWSGGIDAFLRPHPAARLERGGGQAQLRAIVRLATSTDVPQLLTLSSHRAPEVRTAAVLGLAGIGNAARPNPTTPWAPVTDCELPTSPEAAEGVARRLVRLLSMDKDYRVRRASKRALWSWGARLRPHIREHVLPLTRSKRREVALDAIETCGRFQLEEALSGLLKLVHSPADDRTLRLSARALETIDAAAAVKALAAPLAGKKSIPSGSLSSIRALGYMRTRDAFDALVGLLRTLSPRSPARPRVEDALEILTRRRFGDEPGPWNTWIRRARSPFVHRHHVPPRKVRRATVAKSGRFGVSVTTEKAVERALRWFESNQQALGFWGMGSAELFHKSGLESAHTGGALLAFLGAGYSPQAGRYRTTAGRAQEWLLATQHYDGGFREWLPKGRWVHNSYLSALAIWALAESSVTESSKAHLRAVQGGVSFLERTQAPGAGWRYEPHGRESDTSCTVWTMMALKAGQLAGGRIAQRTWDSIEHWLSRCSSDMSGRRETVDDESDDYKYEVGARETFVAGATYRPHQGPRDQLMPTHSMTAAVMVARFFMGWGRSHPFMIGGANLLLSGLPDWEHHAERTGYPPYHYDWYYGTLAMHQMGGRFWSTWNDRIKKLYPEKQVADPVALAGSWDSGRFAGGRHLGTALSVLLLETYYRYSPLMNIASDADTGTGPKDEPK